MLGGLPSETTLRLEPHSQLELKMSFRTRLSAGDSAKVTAGLAVAGRTKLRRIGYVRTLSAELKFKSLGKGEILEDRKIESTRGRTSVAL